MRSGLAGVVGFVRLHIPRIFGLRAEAMDPDREAAA